MAFKQVNIDGKDYVPLATVHLAATPGCKEATALIAAAINMAKADDEVDLDGGLEKLDRATCKLKRAVRAFELRAARHQR
jgi:hypothetical protein